METKIKVISYEPKETFYFIDEKFSISKILELIGYNENSSYEKLKPLAKVFFYKNPKNDHCFCNIYVCGHLALNDEKKYCSGEGEASGHGYCKFSTAFQCALKSSGITLSESVEGKGIEAIKEALIAIGEFLGYENKNLYVAGDN